MLKSTRKKFILIIAATLLFSLSGCSMPEAGKPLSRTNYLLGTLVEISIFDNNNPKLIDKVFSRISEIERKMTINNAETSEIIALNASSGKSPVKLSPDTFYVVEKGRYYSEFSEGRFDITIGPVVKMWNIGTDCAAVPDTGKLEEAVRLVDYNKLTLDSKNHTAKLEVDGMKVDLGAIAKGYAADEAARILRENGVEHAIINLGGNTIVIGGNLKDEPWKIGIQDPFNTRGDFLGIVMVKDKTVVTSGIYERYFERDGKRYHHILDPQNGYPVDNELYSVSIITDSSINADALSTTSLLLGLNEGMKMIEGLDEVEAIFVTNDKKIYISSGLKDNFILAKSEFQHMP